MKTLANIVAHVCVFEHFYHFVPNIAYAIISVNTHTIGIHLSAQTIIQVIQ